MNAVSVSYVQDGRTRPLGYQCGRGPPQLEEVPCALPSVSKGPAGRRMNSRPRKSWCAAVHTVFGLQQNRR
jgi:hypothetical protein